MFCVPLTMTDQEVIEMDAEQGSNVIASHHFQAVLEGLKSVVYCKSVITLGSTGLLSTCSLTYVAAKMMFIMFCFPLTMMDQEVIQAYVEQSKNGIGGTHFRLCCKAYNLPYWAKFYSHLHIL